MEIIDDNFYEKILENGKNPQICPFHSLLVITTFSKEHCNDNFNVRLIVGLIIPIESLYLLRK